jgi:hypothetical protein
MSLTTRKLSQSDVGFKPVRTIAHMVMIFITLSLLLVFFLHTINLPKAEVISKKDLFVFLGIAAISFFVAMITLFANSIGDKKVGFWFSNVDKSGDTYEDKVALFYGNIPNKQALSYLSARRDRDEPNGTWFAYEERELFFGYILLHRKTKELKGDSFGDVTEKTEEFQTLGLPDHLKISF